MLMFLTYIIKSLLLIIHGILMVAFYTVMERKIIAGLEEEGSNLIKPFELLQAIADGLKLLVKKTIIPQTANIMIFIAGPLITFSLICLGWCIIPFGNTLKTLYLVFQSFFQEINYIYFLDKVLEYINLLSKLPIEEILLRICLFLLYIGIIFYNYKTDQAFFKKTHFLVLSLIVGSYVSFTFFSKSFFYIERIILLGMKILVLIFIVFISVLKKIRQENDNNEMCFKSLSPVILNITSFCEFDFLSDFIICFEPSSEISEFEISYNGKDTKVYHPICKSPYSIYNYTLVGYVLKTDIKCLNFRYELCTSYSNQIKDFNNIINYLIKHFETSSAVQKENVEKLIPFLLELKNKTEKSEVFDVFLEIDYLQFVFDNRHLIPEILQFWESLNLNKINNCKLQKKENFKKIKILKSLIRIKPFLLNSLYLITDTEKENLEKILYLFFYPYGDFKKLPVTISTDLDKYEILLCFYGCAINEENLNLEQFTQDIIAILKKSK